MSIITITYHSIVYKLKNYINKDEFHGEYIFEMGNSWKKLSQIGRKNRVSLIIEEQVI